MNQNVLPLPKVTWKKPQTAEGEHLCVWGRAGKQIWNICCYYSLGAIITTLAGARNQILPECRWKGRLGEPPWRAAESPPVSACSGLASAGSSHFAPSFFRIGTIIFFYAFLCILITFAIRRFLDNLHFSISLLCALPQQPFGLWRKQTLRLKLIFNLGYFW